MRLRYASTSVFKPFKEIPGPRGPLGIGNLYNYFPLIGKYKWDALHKSGLDKYKKYGPIVKETMIPGVDIVWLYDPVDIGILLNQKGYPRRRSHLALEKYRRDRPKIYKTAGLLPTNGEEWWRLRSELQKGLSSPKHVRNFLPEVDTITQEFVHQLKTNLTFDILPELSRLNLELICLLAFDERLQCFSKEEKQPTSISSRLIKAAEDTNSSILPTDQGFPFWRYFQTPKYKKLVESQELIESLALEFVTQKVSSFSGNECASKTRNSLLEEYLKNPNLDFADIVCMASDILLAGVDTTTYTTCFLLYHLAENQNVQNCLFEEALSVLKSSRDAITTEILNSKIPYTRAVLKESLRLNPVSIGVGRILSNELVLHGYQVPNETNVVTQNMVACRLEKNFKFAEKFMPERWIDRTITINPHLVLPFGHGIRSCIARRLAEQDMLVLILRIARQFQIEWMGKNKLDVKTNIVNKPDQPVLLKLHSRF